MSDAPKLLLTGDEACAALAVSRKGLFNLTHPRGTLRCVKLGSSVRYSIEELRRFVAEREQA